MVMPSLYWSRNRSVSLLWATQLVVVESPSRREFFAGQPQLDRVLKSNHPGAAEQLGGRVLRVGARADLGDVHLGPGLEVEVQAAFEVQRHRECSRGRVGDLPRPRAATLYLTVALDPTVQLPRGRSLD
jgi:hypothetical protein